MDIITKEKIKKFKDYIAANTEENYLLPVARESSDKNRIIAYSTLKRRLEDLMPYLLTGEQEHADRLELIGKYMDLEDDDVQEFISKSSELDNLTDNFLSIDYQDEVHLWFGKYVEGLMAWGGPSYSFRLYDSGTLTFVYQDWYTHNEIHITDEFAEETGLTMIKELLDLNGILYQE